MVAEVIVTCDHLNNDFDYTCWKGGDSFFHDNFFLEKWVKHFMTYFTNVVTVPSADLCVFAVLGYDSSMI